MSGSSAALAVCVVLSLPACSAFSAAAQAKKDRAWVASMESPTPCPASLPVSVFPKEMDAATACVLASTALRQIALGKADSMGVEAADTASARVNYIMAQHFIGLGGTADGYFWKAQVEFANRKSAICITFDRAEQTIRTSIAEQWQ